MLSLSTVEATLETLERVGQALRLTGPEGSLLYEAASPVHHHLQCLSCRRVLDIQDPTLGEVPLPASSGANSP
jgi:Fe2+ or Zn2+ uptake regulation protein